MYWNDSAILLTVCALLIFFGSQFPSPENENETNRLIKINAMNWLCSHNVEKTP